MNTITGIFDLHIHTNYSDGLMSPEEVINIAKKKNIGVAITDHNEIKGSIKGFELVKDINFLLGIEVGTKDGKEILFYFNNVNEIEKFYKNEVEPYKTNRMTRINREITDFLDVKYNYLFTTIPHPYGPFKKSIKYNPTLSKKILKFVDTIEIYNSTQNMRSNKKSLKLAEKINKFRTASSDAHIKEDIGKGLTYIEIKNNKLVKSTIIKTDEFNILSIIKTLSVIGYFNFNYSILGKKNV
jgi:predicted metal-dependent phosphoesterase TrpH